MEGACGLKNLVFFDLQLHDAGHCVAHSNWGVGTADGPTVVAQLFHLQGLAVAVDCRKIRHKPPVVQRGIGSGNSFRQVVGRGKTVGQVGVGSGEFAVLYGGTVGLQFDAVDRLCKGGTRQGEGGEAKDFFHRIVLLIKLIRTLSSSNDLGSCHRSPGPFLVGILGSRANLGR